VTFPLGGSFPFVMPDGILMVSSSEANTTLQMKNGHPLLYMGGGSICPDSNMQATTAVQFICDKSVFAAGVPHLIPVDQFRD